MRPTKELFRQWRRFRAGELTRSGVKRFAAPVRRTFDALVLRGASSGHARRTGMCRELWDHREWLWTFLDHDGVEITRSAAERALRHVVIWRELSSGTQSGKGRRSLETLLTVIETGRQQSRNIFQFLTTTIQTHFARRNTPSHATRP